jgi:hypothetical protein
MRIGLTAAAIIATLCSPLSAAQVSSTPPDAKTESIVISKAITLRNALVIVTGPHEKVVGQGASQSIARVLYEIDATARWALNDDLNALNAMLGGVDKTLNEMRQKLITDNGGVPLPEKAEDQTVEQKRLLQKFNDDYLELTSSTREVAALFHVRRSDFKEPIQGDAMSIMLQAGIIDP